MVRSALRGRGVRQIQPEPEITVRLRLSVARDLVTVLAKFSNHKMQLLQMGQHDQATRLLNLNLFRVDVEEKVRKAER